MQEKILGKIDFAEYGFVPDYPFLVGIQLGFKLGDGTSIQSGIRYTVNISKNCRYEHDEYRAATTASMEQLYSLLQDAKCTYVSQLINKPVEVTVEGNTFKDFRILTEVL